MKLTAIYLRTSTEKQLKGLESQERAIYEYLNSSIPESKIITFKDFGISGVKSSRPELNRMMKQVKKGLIQQIIVYSFSRFARSTKHLLEALEEFNTNNVDFISITEKVDTSSPMGKAMFTIISAISQLERELISERVKNGLDNAKSKGKKIGRKKTRNSILIRELRLQGMSYSKIAKLANCSKATVHRELVHKSSNMKL